MILTDSIQTIPRYYFLYLSRKLNFPEALTVGKNEEYSSFVNVSVTISG